MESNVELAELIMTTLMKKKVATPRERPTTAGAFPATSSPLNRASTPISKYRVMKRVAKHLQQRHQEQIDARVQMPAPAAQQAAHPMFRQHRQQYHDQKEQKDHGQ